MSPPTFFFLRDRDFWLPGYTDKLDQLTDQCIPSKAIKGKPSLPWISREIKKLIDKRNKFYKSYRKTGNSQLREKYVSLRHVIKKRIKDSHEAYLEGLLGMDRQDNQATGQVDSKKLFQYLKNSRTDQQGISPLKKNDNLHTETKDKADILNQQFQSVFTPLAPLSLKELSLMKVKTLWMTRSYHHRPYQKNRETQHPLCQVSRSLRQVS